MGILFRRPKRVAVVEWGDGELRCAVPTRGAVTTVTFPLTAPPEEQAFEVSRRLQELARRRVLSAPLCVVLPSSACTFKLLKVPVTNGETREQVWKNEAAQQLGLPLAEIETAFAEQPDGVLAVVCRKSFLHTYLAPFTQSDLPIRWVVPSIVGLWVTAAASVGSESLALLELRRSRNRLTHATLAVGKSSGLRLVHSIALNGVGIDWLADELRRALALYHRAFGESVNRLLLVGELRGLTDDERRLLQQLPLPLEELPLPEEGNTVCERVLVALTATVANNPTLLSFPPPQPEPELVWRRVGERLVGATIVLMLVGFFVAIAMSIQVQALRTEMNSLRQVIAQQRRELNRFQSQNYREEVRGLEQIWKQVNDQRNDPLEILYWVSKTLPTSVWVTEVAFLRNGQVVLRGSSLSPSAVTEAARSLSEVQVMRGVPLFTEVLTNYVNTRTEGERTLVDFQLTAWLRERAERRQRQVLRP